MKLWSLSLKPAQSPKMAKADSCGLKGSVDLLHFEVNTTHAYPTSLIQAQPEVGK